MPFNKKNRILLLTSDADLISSMNVMTREFSLLLDAVPNPADFEQKCLKENYCAFFISRFAETKIVIKFMERIRSHKSFRSIPLYLIQDMSNPLSTDLAYLNAQIIDPERDNVSDLISKLSASTEVYAPKLDILVVEDNHEIQNLIRKYLNDMDQHFVFTAATVAQSKSLIKEKRFDVYLLDWNLGDGTCIDIVEFTKSVRPKDNPLQIVITARNEMEDIMLLLEHKITDIIIKPFDFEEFREKVTYAFSKRKASAQQAVFPVSKAK